MAGKGNNWLGNIQMILNLHMIQLTFGTIWSFIKSS